ncbi:MAG: hypothetical protein BGO49_24760 [Planctomycetales bacterium 71-10]|nr:MAG: hypothetical protein BGO49_24760 [Planctomycetales bacterium 71-10]
MLCDLLAMPWRDPANYPLVSPLDATPDGRRARELLRKSKDGTQVNSLSAEEKAEWRRLGDALRPELVEYRRRVDAWLEDERPVLESDSGLPYARIDEIRSKIVESQKFTLTQDFVLASLSKMATPETAIKAAQWFRLTHDPMWLEWNFEDMRMGAVFYSKQVGDEREIWCYVAHGIVKAEHKNFWVNHVRILPETIRQKDDGIELDIVNESGEIVDKESFAGQLAITFYDVIVRINSPRITDIRPCEDQSKINRKRAKLGRPPLFSYHVVDLNKDIKSHLRQVDNEGAGVRFHWRRGHFKACKNGLFWWNPHTAGRKVHGEIRKDYAA